MPEPKRARAEAALDDVSDHLGVVLQRADELLAQWSAFGAQVRHQVEREAAAIGTAVGGAVETAVARATSSGVDRAIADQVGARLVSLTAELGKLEARTRAAARSISDERTGDRRLMWVVIAGIALANALLVVLLLRRPAVAHAPAEPVKLEVVAPAERALPAESAASPPAEDAEAPRAEEPRPADPAAENAPRPEPATPAVLRPIAAAPAGEPGTAASTAMAPALGASAPGARAPAAKLPPRAPPHKR